MVQSFQVCFKGVLGRSRGFPGGSVAPAMQEPQEAQLWSLGWEEPVEEGMATQSSILALENPMDRGAWWATVHGVAKSWTSLKRLNTHTHIGRTRENGAQVWFHLITKANTFGTSAYSSTDYASFALVLCDLWQVVSFISWVFLPPASGVSTYTFADRLSEEA